MPSVEVGHILAVVKYTIHVGCLKEDVQSKDGYISHLESRSELLDIIGL